MFSTRFERPVVLTIHAQQRMIKRDLTEQIILDLIEEGELRYKDERRLWIARRFPGRNDNLICVAAALENALVIKTVMHHFTWEHEP